VPDAAPPSPRLRDDLVIALVRVAIDALAQLCAALERARDAR
jgi:hypothetical protein